MDFGEAWPDFTGARNMLFLFSFRNAALKGPLFHVTAGFSFRRLL
jgi:hypothetical protein